MTATQNNSEYYDIVIAGGNFIGLLLAKTLSYLSQDSLKISVIDPTDIKSLPEDDARAFAISASSKQMLETLGIWSELQAKANPITKIEITDSHLETVIRPVFVNFENKTDTGVPSSYILENQYLKKAIITAITEHKNIDLYPFEKVMSFPSSDKNGHLNVNLQKTKVPLSAKLLVAADGKNSTLRGKANINTVGWDYNQFGIVTKVKHSAPSNQRAFQHFLPSGPFAILPLEENLASIVWSEQSDHAKQIMSYDDEAFLNELTKRFGLQLGSIELAGPRKTFPLNLKIARELVAERFALIGDAAHGVHPIAGLGLNMGIRDIAALSEQIIETQRLGMDIGSQVTLQKYSQWRRFDNAVSAFTMDTLNRLFSNDNASVRMIRDVGLGIVDKIPEIKNFFVKEASGLSGDVPKLLKGEKV